MAKRISVWVLAGFYSLAGLNHFIAPEFYTPMIPPYLPAGLVLVYLSGIVEIGLGIGLLVARTRVAAAWSVILMLLAFMPVHIYMLTDAERFPDVPMGLLWARLPVQALLMGWAFWHTRSDAPEP